MTRTYTPTPAPDEGVTALPAPYAPQRKAFFLSHMLRAAQSVPMFRTINTEEGNPWHRLLSLFAELLERASFTAAATALWAIREGAYRAWYHPRLFRPRAPQTFARGQVQLSLDRPAAAADLIPAGTLVGAPDGRTVGLERDTLFPQGALSVLADVVATTPGPGGNLEAGMLTQLFGGSQRYRVVNPGPVAGGAEAESDSSVYARFQDRVEGSATGNRLSVFSAAKNAQRLNAQGEPVEVVRDVALIYPWAIPSMNGEMGFGYAVIDNGSGGASDELIALAQEGVDPESSVMERTQVIAASRYVVPLSLRAYATRTADPEQIRAALRAAWTEATAGKFIEDGTGRGRLALLPLGKALDAAHRDLTTVVILNLEADVLPPIGSRIVGGIVDVDVRRGELVRP